MQAAPRTIAIQLWLVSSLRVGPGLVQGVGPSGAADVRGHCEIRLLLSVSLHTTALFHATHFTGPRLSSLQSPTTTTTTTSTLSLQRRLHQLRHPHPHQHQHQQHRHLATAAAAAAVGSGSGTPRLTVGPRRLSPEADQFQRHWYGEVRAAYSGGTRALGRVRLGRGGGAVRTAARVRLHCTTALSRPLKLQHARNPTLSQSPVHFVAVYACTGEHRHGSQRGGTGLSGGAGGLARQAVAGACWCLRCVLVLV